MNRFLEWEKGTGQRQSYSAFARYLGVKQSTLSQWLTGNYPPNIEHVRILAEKLGSDIYSVMGLGVNDPRLQELQKAYDAIPESNRSELFGLIEGFLEKIGARRLD